MARDRRDLFAVANAWWSQGWSALERANPEDWSIAVSSYDQVAQELLLPAQTGLAASLRSTAAQVAGRLDEARTLAETAATDLTRAGHPSAQMLHLARSVLIGWDDGQAGELLPLMTSLAGDFASVATFQAGLALTAALAGDHELARHLLDRVAASGFSRIRPDVEWLAVVSFYSHACTATGVVEHGRRCTTCWQPARPPGSAVGRSWGGGARLTTTWVPSAACSVEGPRRLGASSTPLPSNGPWGRRTSSRPHHRGAGGPPLW